MKSNLKGFAENLLFVLNILIVFFLLFESKIVIPHWLIPVGRMHPMILHFPIAILILAMVLEFFRFKDKYQAELFYQRFTSNLLLIGLISAAVTVIMGLFLSKEEGYEGSILQWHKWTGVSIVLVASVIYWCRNFTWYNAPLAKGGAVVTILCLVLAGHFGATLTHGESFVLGPILPQKTMPQVSLEQAQVYEHVVKPILEAKCNSCHNPEKLKGQLMLTDEASILKGGKTGKLIIPGKPELSLLIQRIHLPAEDKKHMPPTGKPQLTDEEALLLQLWVKNGADFKRKVVDLPANDSLRKLASLFIKPAIAATPAYAFEAASEATIKNLNNDYRTVTPLAKGSPALAVNLYNRANYKAKQLDELGEIKKQIVSLDLNMMPVKDDDLKYITSFENLTALNLNFTDVNGSGLSKIAGLKNLRTLSLSGSKVTLQNLQQIKGFKALKTLTLWNTGIAAKDIEKLQDANKNIQIISGYKDDGKAMKLNPPQLNNAQQIFKQTTALKLKHPIRGVEIRYTLDGNDPDSLKSPAFNKNILLNKHTTVRAKAFKKGWISSDIVEFKFYKSAYTPDTIYLTNQPVERYAANGAQTLIDNELADLVNLNNRWLGFEKKDMEVFMHFDKPVNLSSVMVQNVSLPLFLLLPPAQIDVWCGPNEGNLKLLGTVKPAVPKVPGVSVYTDSFVGFKPQKVQFLKLRAKTQFVLLVDEIFLN
ncbi:cytochrome C [Mucilaginibacter limnophilus]|uniref:Cytochrome C n=1 Tax=Mucilaginibacter limnophilus TaxID=1932778 RepID=A0A437MT53_9SPHI|nr:DUF2231 domain-containing protein [Mucilaginibacter limnophilus]RVU00822.1 cytochrome C [Mucilaginibacter limnophilus]